MYCLEHLLSTGICGHAFGIALAGMQTATSFPSWGSPAGANTRGRALPCSRPSARPWARTPRKLDCHLFSQLGIPFGGQHTGVGLCPAHALPPALGRARRPSLTATSFPSWGSPAGANTRGRALPCSRPSARLWARTPRKLDCHLFPQLGIPYRGPTHGAEPCPSHALPPALGRARRASSAALALGHWSTCWPWGEMEGTFLFFFWVLCFMFLRRLITEARASCGSARFGLKWSAGTGAWGNHKGDSPPRSRLSVFRCAR